jgi:hypothetical protein
MGITQEMKGLHDRYERGELTRAEYSAAKADALRRQSKRHAANKPKYRAWNRAVRILTVHAYKCAKCSHRVTYSKAKLSYKWEGKKPICPCCGFALNIWKTTSAGERPRLQK